MVTRKLLAVLFVLSMVAAFILPALAQEIVKGKVEALDEEAKEITINGTQYSLSDEAAQVEVEVGDEVEASVEGGVIIDLEK